VRQPKRIAAAYLWQAGIPWDAPLPPLQVMDSQEQAILRTQLEKGINTPLTSSMGRLFDAVSSLIGLRQSINYEAQAAIELENVADLCDGGIYPFDLGNGLIDPKPLLEALLTDIKGGISPAMIASRFHQSVVKMVLQVCENLRRETGIHQVALSGGSGRICS
jgi:hydrogenase maturation protein HypF